MSLSRDPAFSVLQNSLVCGYRDISEGTKSEHAHMISSSLAGQSMRHDPGYEVDTTNGAGSRNLQIYLLAPDGTLLHCLPGFWSPDDLVHEIELAEKLRRVWDDPEMTREQKDDRFVRMHREHAAAHSPGMAQRSEMQGFDKQFEETRLLAFPEGPVPSFHTEDTIDPDGFERLASSDLVANGDEIRAARLQGYMPHARFKTLDQVVHDRMIRQPFTLVRSSQSLTEFNVLGLADYGQNFYDRPVGAEPPPGSTIDRERRRAALEAGEDGGEVAAGSGSSETFAAGSGSSEPVAEPVRELVPVDDVTTVTPTDELVLYAINESPEGFVGSVEYQGTSYIVSTGSVLPDEGPARYTVSAIGRDELSLVDSVTGEVRVCRLSAGAGD